MYTKRLWSVLPDPLLTLAIASCRWGRLGKKAIKTSFLLLRMSSTRLYLMLKVCSEMKHVNCPVNKIIQFWTNKIYYCDGVVLITISICLTILCRWSSRSARTLILYFFTQVLGTQVLQENLKLIKHITDYRSEFHQLCGTGPKLACTAAGCVQSSDECITARGRAEEGRAGGGGPDQSDQRHFTPSHILPQ